MKKIEETIEGFEVGYNLEGIADLEKILFLDIETTGFTARSSNVYLIGCVYYSAEKWHTIQWFAQTYEEEKDILIEFFEFAKFYSCLMHFNGNRFDLPYLSQKAEMLGLPYNFEGFDGVDIYRRIEPYKYFCKLPGCKQKMIEQYLGVTREDMYSGGELINEYHNYVKEPSEYAETLILLHNRDDLRGMLSILPILNIYDLFHLPSIAKKVQANTYRDLDDNTRKELLITVTLPCTLPKPVSHSSTGCYFKAEGNEAIIKVPIYEEEMKYFYDNYKDYYYLPEEDLALHKSVATFVEKEYRTQATAATCYTRKQSSYLPQWDILIEPFFKRDYKSKEYFFELTEERKSDRELFTLYANHILQTMADNY